MSFWRLNWWNAWDGVMPYILNTWQDLTGFLNRDRSVSELCCFLWGYRGHWMLATSSASAATGWRSGLVLWSPLFLVGVSCLAIWQRPWEHLWTSGHLKSKLNSYDYLVIMPGRLVSGVWIACSVDRKLHRFEKNIANYNQLPPCLRLFLLLLLLLPLNHLCVADVPGDF